MKSSLRQLEAWKRDTYTFRLRIALLLLLVAMLIAISLGFVQTAGASTFVVDRADDDAAAVDCTSTLNDCSLRGAIIKANLSSGPDTITLPAGTYTLTIVGTNESLAADGDLDITDDLTINGAGSGVTIINGNGVVTSERVLEVPNVAANVVLQNLTIQGGSHTLPGSGGGISHFGTGTLTLNDCIVAQNYNAVQGGGIYSLLGNLILSNTEVSGNSTPGSGGGIYKGSSGSQLSISNSMVHYNQSTDPFTLGGGIYYGASGALSITDTTITDNSADDGSGIALKYSSGAVYLTRATISRNSSTGAGSVSVGGGLYLEHTGTINILDSTIADNDAFSGGGFYIVTGTVIIDGTTISNNRATDVSGSGGGIVNRAALFLSNSTVTGNTADQFGGGIYQWSFGSPASTSLTHTTITGNTPDGDTNGSGDGGGIYAYDGSVTMVNSIIADNAEDQCAANAGTFSSLGYNLSSDATCGLTSSGDQTSTAPMLYPLADNGGETSTHSLMPFSPAIDSALGSACPIQDQRGISRPQGVACDIGAFEQNLLEILFLPLINR